MSQILWYLAFQQFLISIEFFLVCFSDPNHNYNRHPVTACAPVRANEKQMRISFYQVCKWAKLSSSA